MRPPARTILFCACAAAAATTQALALMSDDVERSLDRAVALGTIGRHREAVPDLDPALAADPQRPDAMAFRAAAWQRLDRTETARRDIERVPQLDRENAEPLLERGILRQLGGHTEGSRMDWEQAIELAPNSATADLLLQNVALNQAGSAAR